MSEDVLEVAVAELRPSLEALLMIADQPLDADQGIQAGRLDPVDLVQLAVADHRHRADQDHGGGDRRGPTQGDVPVDRVVRVASRAIADGADSISFGDTTGMATPGRVWSLVGEFRSAHPDPEASDEPFGIHRCLRLAALPVHRAGRRHRRGSRQRGEPGATRGHGRDRSATRARSRSNCSSWCRPMIWRLTGRPSTLASALTTELLMFCGASVWVRKSASW